MKALTFAIKTRFWTSSDCGDRRAQQSNHFVDERAPLLTHCTCHYDRPSKIGPRYVQTATDPKWERIKTFVGQNARINCVDILWSPKNHSLHHPANVAQRIESFIDKNLRSSGDVDSWWRCRPRAFPMIDYSVITKHELRRKWLTFNNEFHE